MPAPTIRIAAAGDIHCHEGNRAEVTEAFARIGERAGLVLLAGDLATHRRARADSSAGQRVQRSGRPHLRRAWEARDWHANRINEVVQPPARTDGHGDRSPQRDPQGARRRRCACAAPRTSTTTSSTRNCRNSASRSYARSTREEAGAEVRTAGRRPRRDRRVLDPDQRCCSPSPTTTTLEGEAGRRCGRTSAATAWPNRSPSTNRLIVLHGHGHDSGSRASSARSRSSTSSIHIINTDFLIFRVRPRRGQLCSHKRSDYRGRTSGSPAARPKLRNSAAHYCLRPGPASAGRARGRAR